MKASTKKASAPMIGRRVKLTFPSYDTEAMSQNAYKGRSRIEILKECLGSHMAGYAWRIAHIDQEAEVVNARNDGGFIYSLLFADGQIFEAYVHDFIVLPEPPAKPADYEFVAQEILLHADGESALERLDKWGRQGFQAVGVTQGSVRGHIVLLQRQVQ